MQPIKTGPLGKAKAKIYTGIRIEADGRELPEFFHEADFLRCFSPVPVVWKGAAASLYFWNWIPKKTPFNRIASDLILHPEFVIKGTALVTTQVDRWHQFRVPGDIVDARNKVEHLGLEENKQVVFKPAGRHRTHQYIYVKSYYDAFAVRMAL